MQTSGLQVICAAAGACSGNGTDTCARSIGRREKASGECAEGLRDRRGARKSSEGTPRGARVRRARGEERSWGSTDAACAQHSKCGWQQAAAAERDEGDGGGGEVGGAMERRRGREGGREVKIAHPFVCNGTCRSTHRHTHTTHMHTDTKTLL